MANSDDFYNTLKEQVEKNLISTYHFNTLSNADKNITEDFDESEYCATLVEQAAIDIIEDICGSN